MNLLGGASFQRLESALQAATIRQQVYANNVANVEVPNFKRSDVRFEELLSNAISGNGQKMLVGKTTHARHIPINGYVATPSAQVVTDQSSSMNNNKNNVDIDKEMALLAENQLRYNLFVQQINHDVKMLRTGIEGRGN